MAFGDDLGPSVKVCCGPRCGQEPDHRALYAAVEAVSSSPVRPSGCLGHCHGGVTIILTDGQIRKLQQTRQAGEILTPGSGNS